MRFSEKSFEVRFCAALSAAAMPFNRNPQWFGLTQAQERQWGIDTMVRLGGRLLVFQFKAKQKADHKLKFEKFQWEALRNVSARRPRSVFYVLPDPATTLDASKVGCILKHSWLCEVARLGSAFRVGAETATLRLEPTTKQLVQRKPNRSVRVSRCCDVLGCFCPTTALLHLKIADNSTQFLSLRGGNFAESGLFEGMADGAPFGISMGDAKRPGDSVAILSPEEPIGSAEEFEGLLGEEAARQMPLGLSGLFLPNAG